MDLACGEAGVEGGAGMDDVGRLSVLLPWLLLVLCTDRVAVIHHRYE